MLLCACGRTTVSIVTPPDASKRMMFGAEQLKNSLEKAGYQVISLQTKDAVQPDDKVIILTQLCDSTVDILHLLSLSATKSCFSL